MEMWDILDRNGMPTGKTVKRKKFCLQKGEYHSVVHIWVLGSDGRVLIQRRSLTKPLMPGEWAAIGGSAVSGEDALTAARRELEEEMGIAAEPEQLRLIKQMVRKNSILSIFLIRCDVSVTDLILQEDEVSEARWVHRNKLRQMIRTRAFHNYGNEYFDAVFSAFETRPHSRRRKKRYEQRHRK